MRKPSTAHHRPLSIRQAGAATAWGSGSPLGGVVPGWRASAGRARCGPGCAVGRQRRSRSGAR